MVNTACPRPDLLVAVEEGVLPEGLAREVRSHLAACPLCAQLQRDLRDSAMSEPTLEGVARVRERVHRGIAPGALGRRSGSWKYGWAAALAASILGGVYLASRPVGPARDGKGHGPATIAQAPAQPPQYRLPLEPAPLRLPLASAMLFRGKEESGGRQYLADLGGALQPYREGRYAQAIEALTALGARYPEAVEPRFYLGVSYLLAGDAAGAMGPLERARQIGGEALNDDIAWYLGVAGERAGNWNQAAGWIGPLCRGEGAYRAAACAGLREK